MRAWFNTPTSEFVDQLRDVAIKANARPQIIDAIDNIVEGPTEDEIEERCEAAACDGVTEGCKEMWERCFDLLDDELDEYDGISSDAFEHIKTLLCSIKPRD